MSPPPDSIEKMYTAYMPEMISIVVDIYEQYRNMKLPADCTPYRVNRKRYDDAFWKELIAEHLHHRFKPDRTIYFARSMCGGQAPWPELYKAFPRILRADHRLGVQFNSVVTGKFDLGCFRDCSTPEKLRKSLEEWKNLNRTTSSVTDESQFCYELISGNFGYLTDTPEGRNLSALTSLAALEEGGREKLRHSVGKLMDIFCVRL